LQGTYPNPTLKPPPATRLLSDSALSNGWLNGDLAGSRQVGYFKDLSGVVHLQGLADHSGVTNQEIFTLPPGMRPAKVTTFAATSGGPTYEHVYVNVYNDGRVFAPTNHEVWLEGITFRADQ
jgi:hypothetical protein